jgi:adenylate kinase
MWEKQAKDYVVARKLVPDDMIIGVAKERLAMPDCKVLGLLLDGFACMPAQAKVLVDAGITANCFIFLKVLNNILMECVLGRQANPVSGIFTT